MVFLARVHLAPFLALSLFYRLVSSWCDHSMLASLLEPCITVNSSLFTSALLRTHSFVFFAVHKTPRIFLSISSQRRQDVFLHSVRVQLAAQDCVIIFQFLGHAQTKHETMTVNK